MSNGLIDSFASKIEKYLLDLSDLIIFVFNSRGEITEVNDKFRELFSASTSGSQEIFIEDILSPGDKESFSMPEEGEYIRQNVKFQRSSGTPYFAECVIFPGDNNYLLIGKHRLITSEDALDKISKLNDELANKTRKLTKKNKELKKAKARIEKIMRTDELTNLANRRAFMEFLSIMLAQRQRYDKPLTLLMLDLDDFKDINDNYGHIVGDKVLRKIGEILTENTREGDMAARLGGDEFILLLVETTTVEADKIAQRLNNEIKQIKIPQLEKLPTLSLGITEARADEDIEGLLARADEAMYKAKKAGKDKIVRMT